MTERATLFPLRHLRVRMPLSDGHMDVCLAPDASSETIAAVTRGGRIPFPLGGRPSDGVRIVSHCTPASRLREAGDGSGDLKPPHAQISRSAAAALRSAVEQWPARLAN